PQARYLARRRTARASRPVLLSRALRDRSGARTPTAGPPLPEGLPRLGLHSGLLPLSVPRAARAAADGRGHRGGDGATRGLRPADLHRAAATDRGPVARPDGAALCRPR